MKITQGDIVNSAVSATRFSTFGIGTTLELQQNLTFSGYALGMSSGMTQSTPLQIHENVSGTSAGWFDESSWAAVNVAITTITYVPTVSSGTIISTTVSSQAVDGDLIGIFGIGAWSTISNLNGTRSGPSGVGSQNASLMSGGLTSASTNIVESFNGSSWSLLSNLNTARQGMAGAGTQYAAVAAAGFTTSNTVITELFNGSSWSNSGSTNIAKVNLAGGGSQYAAFTAGGFAASNISATELFNGSTWSLSGASGSLLVVISQLSGLGSQNAALVAGGTTATSTNATEIFNGTAWMYSGNLNISKAFVAAAGVQNAGIVAGGSGPVSSTELFNGSVWCFSSNMNPAVSGAGGSGSQNAALAAGGTTSTVSAQAQTHNQTTYAKLTPHNIKEAKAIGIAFMSGSTTASVVYNGYIGNLAISSSNIAITAATAPGTFAVLSKYFPNAATASLVHVINPNADDMIVGYNISLTQMYVYGNSLNSYEYIIRW